MVLLQASLKTTPHTAQNTHTLSLRLEGSQCPARLLEEVTIIDTPGVLSGEKQRLERNYNFVEIADWFATRSDLVFLLFDPAKLDISDEFKSVISVLRNHSDKVGWARHLSFYWKRGYEAGTPASSLKVCHLRWTSRANRPQT